MKYVAAILYAVSSSVLLGLLLGWQRGHLDAQSALISLSGGALVGLIGLWFARNETSHLEKPRGWGWVPVVLFALFSLRAFLWLVFRQGDELRVLSPNNTGDLPLHIAFIRYFANGAPFWPDSPIFSAGKLTYAAGTDFFNSLLTLAGMDVERGLVWVGLIGAVLTGIAIWRWGGAFTLMGFLCGGGLLGFAAFFRDAGEPFFQDYAGIMKFDAAWKSLPLALLVTQRGFLFALPAGLLLLSSWRTKFFQNGEGWRMPFAGELLLYAAIPFFHMHTFIALSFMLAVFFIAQAAARWKILGLVFAAIIPASVLVWITLGMFQTNALPLWGNMDQIENPPPRPPTKVLGWQPGWMVNDTQTQQAWQSFTKAGPAAAPLQAHGQFLIFWLGNFGAWPFVTAALVLALLRALWRRTLHAKHVWLGALAFVFITPLLGLWTGYQGDTWVNFFHPIKDPITRNTVARIAALAALIGGVMLHFRRARDFGLRWVLLGFAAISILDGLLTMLHGWCPDVALLRVNALPLLAATIALFTLLLQYARRRDPSLWHAVFVLPGLFLFFLCCNVRFAPWAWDNTKVMVWAWLIVLPFLWEHLIARWKCWQRLGVCVLLFFSGFVGLIGGLDRKHQGYAIARCSTLDAVAIAVRDIPITEPFACAPHYQHALLLNGRKVILGYEGHLQSHGINYRITGINLDELMNGIDIWRLNAAELNVRYIFYGPLEIERWPRSRESWRNSAQVIASGPWGELFDLDLPRVPLEQ